MNRPFTFVIPAVFGASMLLAAQASAPPPIEEITIARDQTHDSARNRFAGRVTEVSTLGALTRVTIDVRGVPLVAALTTRSAHELQLAPGIAVVATFKAMAVHLC